MKNVKVMTMLLAVMVVLCGPAISNADFAQFTAVQDTSLRSDTGWKDYGTGTYLPMWAGPTRTGNVLVRFDLTGTDMETIESVSMSFFFHQNGLAPGQSITMDVYRIKEANSWDEAQAWWGEGLTGAAWAGGATGCGTSGVDYYAALAGTVTLANGDPTGWRGIEPTGDPVSGDVGDPITIDASVIQAWADDSSCNVGFVFIPTSGDGTDAYIQPVVPHEHSAPIECMLNITYTPEPATMTLLLLGLPFALRRRR